MSIDSREARAALSLVEAQCSKCTDIVLVAKEVTPHTLAQTALGSAVCLEVDGQTVLVTCNHVVAKGEYHYCGPKRLGKPMMDAESNGVARSPVLYRSTQLDLAVLRYGRGAEEKDPWPLEHANDVDYAFLEPQIGTAAFILGVWGEQTRAASYPDGQLYIEAPRYAGIGPLRTVTELELVGDFAEVEILSRSPELERLADIQPTGGVRNLKGISGSGLWMILDGEPLLVGIVHGPNDGRVDEHLIRATPVWVLRDWLAALPLACDG